MPFPLPLLHHLPGRELGLAVTWVGDGAAFTLGLAYAQSKYAQGWLRELHLHDLEWQEGVGQPEGSCKHVRTAKNAK